MDATVLVAISVTLMGIPLIGAGMKALADFLVPNHSVGEEKMASRRTAVAAGAFALIAAAALTISFVDFGKGLFSIFANYGIWGLCLLLAGIFTFAQWEPLKARVLGQQGLQVDETKTRAAYDLHRLEIAKNRLAVLIDRMSEAIHNARKQPIDRSQMDFAINHAMGIFNLEKRKDLRYVLQPQFGYRQVEEHLYSIHEIRDAKKWLEKLQVEATVEDLDIEFRP